MKLSKIAACVLAASLPKDNEDRLMLAQDFAEDDFLFFANGNIGLVGKARKNGTRCIFVSTKEGWVTSVQHAPIFNDAYLAERKVVALERDGVVVQLCQPYAMAKAA